MTPYLGGNYRTRTMEGTRDALADLMQNTHRTPERIRRSFARIAQTDALTWAESVCDDFYNRGRLAVICGVPDAGKTFAAFALAGLGYLRHGYVWQWFQAQAFFKMAWDDKQRADYNDAWVRPATLILDDLGAESETKTSTLEANLYDGLNLRYAEHLPTVITTNLPLEMLLARYGDFGERLKSRIAEWGEVVELVKPTGLRALGDNAPVAPDDCREPAQAPKGLFPVGEPRPAPKEGLKTPEKASFDFELGDEERAALEREKVRLWVEQEERGENSNLQGENDEQHDSGS